MRRLMCHSHQTVGGAGREQGGGFSQLAGRGGGWVIWVGTVIQAKMGQHSAPRPRPDGRGVVVHRLGRALGQI